MCIFCVRILNCAYDIKIRMVEDMIMKVNYYNSVYMSILQ